MKQLRIVHLSDLHLSQENSFETSHILRSLLQDIGSRVKIAKLSDAFVVVSGDLTYSGTKSEFDLVTSFARRLREEVSPQDILFAPGNHDLDWSEHKHTPDNAELMDDLVERGQDGILRVSRRFEDEKTRPTLRACMSNYYAFLKDRNINQPYTDYLYSLKSVVLEKFKINLLSLNSAFLFSPKHNYYGFLGQPQIERATSEADSASDVEASYRIFNVVFFHHPFEAIVPISQQETENTIKSRADLILTGHVHNLRVYLDLTAGLVGADNTRGHPLISGSRAVFDEVHDPQIIPGYSMIEVSLDGDAVRALKIWEVRYDKVRRLWFHDPTVPQPFEIPFPITQSQLPGKRLHASPLRIATLRDVLSWGWTGEDVVAQTMKLDWEAIEGLDELHEGQIKQWVPIALNHPDTWRLLIDSPRSIVGYWHFVSLFDNEFSQAKEGKLDIGVISSDKVESIELPGEHKILLLTMSLKLEFRKAESWKLLIDSFLDCLTDFAEHGSYVTEICGIALSSTEEGFLRSMGMRMTKKHFRSGVVYCMGTTPFPNLNLYARHTRLLELYSSRFSQRESGSNGGST